MTVSNWSAVHASGLCIRFVLMHRSLALFNLLRHIYPIVPPKETEAWWGVAAPNQRVKGSKLPLQVPFLIGAHKVLTTGPSAG